MMFRLLVLVLFVGLPVVKTAAPAPESVTNTSRFYTIRRDLRRCAVPVCGGYYIKLINQPRTRCPNGRVASECYISAIEWNGLPAPDKDGAIVRGSLAMRTGQPNGVLRAREVWLPASDNQPSGKFFRVRDRGLRCIAAPCETHEETKLNTNVSRNVAGVDLSGAKPSENAVSEAVATMPTPDGVLVSGTHEPVTGPAGQSLQLKANQLYLRVNPATSEQGPKPSPQKTCFKTGCSGQVCADEEVITTCEFRPEYECYQKARCERQANGQCGFTDTPELRRCLKRN